MNGEETNEYKPANQDFHTVIVVAPEHTPMRRWWRVDADTERVAKLYNALLTPRRGSNLFLKFEDVDIDAVVTHWSREGAGAIRLEVKRQVGLSGLVLGGKSSAVDQRYSKRFILRCASKRWRLPLPPLEVASRPLFYYVLYRLDEGPDGQEWVDLAENVIRKANGLGVALLRSANCPV